MCKTDTFWSRHIAFSQQSILKSLHYRFKVERVFFWWSTDFAISSLRGLKARVGQLKRMPFASPQQLTHYEVHPLRSMESRISETVERHTLVVWSPVKYTRRGFDWRNHYIPLEGTTLPCHFPWLTSHISPDLRWYQLFPDTNRLGVYRALTDRQGEMVKQRHCLYKVWSPK